MSDQNTTPVDSTDDLDAFSKDFFGQNDPKPVEEEPAKPSEDEAKNDTDDSASDDTELKSDSDSETQTDDTDEDETEEEKDDSPKPKKGRFQDRINELTTARREAERKAADLERRLAELESAKQAPKTENPTPQSEVKAPTPEDKNEDGSEKYPLGEFDPGFIRDLTKHTIAEERAAIKAEADQQSKLSEQERAQAELNAEWENKLNPARERYPDFQEKAESLVDVFSGLDQQYGDFLAQTIMSMDNGTDVLYYLANNHDVADQIVRSGATKAAIALGRIEATVTAEAEEKPTPRPKVSKAPAPPPHQNKGSATVRATVPPDTDDLEAFAKEFFKKR